METEVGAASSQVPYLVEWIVFYQMQGASMRPTFRSQMNDALLQLSDAQQSVIELPHSGLHRNHQCHALHDGQAD